MKQWSEKKQTQAEVKVFILDHLLGMHPDTPNTPEATEMLAAKVFDHIWHQSGLGPVGGAVAAASSGDLPTSRPHAATRRHL